MAPFYGRTRELQMLLDLLSKKTASLVVIKGRRRIGKSRLTKEFSLRIPKAKTYTFVGLPPEKKVTQAMQRAHFALQMKQQFQIPGIDKIDEWSDLLWHLAQQTKHGRVVIIFDEINWMGSKDPAFLGKLKTAWDELFKNNPQLILILSGSMSAWIEKNIILSTGYVGRVSLDITLEELPLKECDHFWDPHANKVSAHEKLQVLSVTGGIPRYLEEVHPEWSSKKNIQTLCFQKEGFLFQEFNKIFSDLFSTKGDVYKRILTTLAQKTADLTAISAAIGMHKGGALSEYLENLTVTGFVSQDKPWDFSSGRHTKPAYYRLSDNYMRFYLRYIEPLKERIKREGSIEIPSWDAIMGLQFENLVLHNRKKVYETLGLPANEILNENPYVQRQTRSTRGCQIDYLIQTIYNTLYVCEIKCSKKRIGKSIIGEVQEKIDRLAVPAHFSVRPVLIFVNGVSDEVKNTSFFTHLIDFGDFLGS